MTDSTPLTPAASIPAGIHAASDYERLAERYIASASYAYIAGGSGADRSAAANLAAFGGWSICPRPLRDMRDGHTRLQLGAAQFQHPIFLAPVAHQALVHPLAELESARAAAAMDACMLSSTLSSQTLEDIARVSGAQRWFQLYLQPRREDSLDLLRRAEAAGYQAIVLTVDGAIQAASHRALAAGFQMPAQCRPANLRDYPMSPLRAPATGESRVFQGLMHAAARWEDVDWLLAQTKLPVWIKGILHADDAIDLQRRGVAGVIVSNHGGRSLDSAPAPLTRITEIRAAVGADFPLLMDGGIRSGADVFLALALGADAVLIGRLQLYALAVAGALGVAHLLKLLREELEMTMALAGCATLADMRSASIGRLTP